MYETAPLPVVTPLTAWRTQQRIEFAARRVAARLEAQNSGALEELSEYPLMWVEGNVEVEVRWRPQLTSSCSVHASYSNRTMPPMITIERSGTAERNNFTILHELAHHLQQTDSEWVYDVLAGLDRRSRWIIEERVCDLFASQTLLPEAKVTEILPLRSTVTAPGLRNLYLRANASRSACCARVANRPGDRVVMFTDLDGTPFYSAGSGELFAPKKGTPQPDICRFVDEAQGHGRRYQSDCIEGLRFSTGKTLRGIRFDVAVDEPWAFVVVTQQEPLARPEWANEDSQCPECMMQYDVEQVHQTCNSCGHGKCPSCGACDCSAQTSVCEKCFVTLSSREQREGRRTHDECL